MMSGKFNGRWFLGGDLGVVRAAVFYIVTRQRSAWHGSWSSRYKGPTSLNPSLRESMAVAERWRAQGSQFSIQEVPGLLVLPKSKLYGIALVEFHSNNSFGRWIVDESILRVGAPAEGLLNRLTVDGQWDGPIPLDDSFVSGRVEDIDGIRLVSEKTTFRAWSSNFEGADAPISWQFKPGRHIADGVRKIESEFMRINESGTKEDEIGVARRGNLHALN